MLRDGDVVAGDHRRPIVPAVGPTGAAGSVVRLADHLARRTNARLAVARRSPRPGSGSAIRPVRPMPHGATSAAPSSRLCRGDCRRARRHDRGAGYEVSFALVGQGLAPAARRFGVARDAAHLERLVAEAGAGRGRDQSGPLPILRA